MMSRFALFVVCVAVGCGGSQKPNEPAREKNQPASNAPSDGAATEPELRPAEEILDGYIEATGGRAAYEAQKSRHTRATISVPKMNLEGTMEAWEKAPDKSLAIMDIQGIGKTEIGVNGDLAWEKSAMTGARILEGQELVERLRDADFYGDINWREHYPSVETVGTEEVDGERAWVVEMTPETGEPMRRWFRVEDGLLVKMEQTADTQMGKIKVTGTFDDYRRAGDVLMPHLATESAMGAEQRIVIDEVDVNVDIPDSRFDPPEDVGKLLDK